jgi:Zn finger protein HypA/HybF involved in hydrogenase expression
MVRKKQRSAFAGPRSARPESATLSLLSCFVRWGNPAAAVPAAAASPSLKMETACRECGSVFIKYAYEKTVRCPTCRTGRLGVAGDSKS